MPFPFKSFTNNVLTLLNTGKNSFMWLGPRPRVFILDPDRFKEMATKVYDFQKPDTSPLFKLLASGFANYDGDKWAKHRKIVSPAFNVEKLKVSLSFISVHLYDLQVIS